MAEKIIPTDDEVLFLPLGGSGEIGMNLNLYGYKGKWLMVDLGVTFGNTLGLEVITPDPQFILDNRENLVGLVLTHAHEDHLGAVPYIWPKLKCPIYATPFTAILAREKLKEVGFDNPPIHEIPLSGSFSAGPFDLQFVTLTHSIPEPNALMIKTEHGVIAHTGDWKIDPNPLIGEVTDEETLKSYGDKGVLAVVCDSTNVFEEGTSGSEATVRDNLTDVIGRCQGRVVVACFASNVARLESAALAAQKHGRFTALVGRSLWRMTDAAKKCGYLKDLPPFLDEKDASKLDPSKVLYICTGSQGESRAALSRIASKQHPIVKLEEGDLVIFSSRVIPGNEQSISFLQNKLVRDGVEILSHSDDPIHVSGHPYRDELKAMYGWLKPKIAVPVHGEMRHLVEHAKLARSLGVPHAAVPENGLIIRLTPGLPEIVGDVTVGRMAVDGPQLVPLNSLSVKDRSKLAATGMIFVSVVLNRGILADDPLISLKGIEDPGTLMEQEIEDAVSYIAHDSSHLGDDELCEAIRVAARKVVYQHLDKKPVTQVHLHRIR